MTNIKKQIDQEIIFRISFDGIDDSCELVLTGDGKYNFVSKEILEQDKNTYQEHKLEWTFCTLKINQKYYEQYLQTAENWLGRKIKFYDEKENNWNESDNETLFSFELYQKVIWEISHDASEKYPGATKLDKELAKCIHSYLYYCNFLYTDGCGEYSRDRMSARDELDKMKVYIDEAWSGKISEAEFQQFYEKSRDHIMAIKIEESEIITYLNDRKYLARVVFQTKNPETITKITEFLVKTKDFVQDENCFIAWRMDDDERVDKIFDYAYALYEGRDYEQDYELAYKIFKNFAEKLNRPDALYYMGLYYQEGYGVVEKNIKTAIKYYEKALKAGDFKYSANNLGVIYATGNGVPKDEKKALKYYEIAAEHGDAYAMASLAKYYEEGKLVERNRLKALELYHNAEVQMVGRYSDFADDFREELAKDLERLKKELK